MLIWRIFQNLKLIEILIAMNNIEIITPRTRKEMEHNIALVFENSLNQVNSEDEVTISSFAYFTLPHLQSLQLLPNGRILLSSINESLRSQANMRYNMQFMPELKLVKNDAALLNGI